jgi:GNAT superfamily N-acetyltransferase
VWLAESEWSKTCAHATMNVVSSALRVRAATVADAGAVAKLNEVVQGLHFAAHPVRFLPADESRVGATFRDWLSPRPSNSLPGSRETRAWICEETENPLGYVIAVLRERPLTPFTRASRWIDVDQVAVREAEQRHGVGRLLLEAVTDWARGINVTEMQLTVWSFNERAHAFFVACGFADIQHRMSADVTSFQK